MGIWCIQGFLLFDGLAVGLIACFRLLGTSRRRRSRPNPAGHKRIVFVVVVDCRLSGRLCRQRWRAVGACHTAHDSSAATPSPLGDCPAADDSNLGGHVAVLFFEHLWFLLIPHLDGVLLDCAVRDAVVKVHDGDTAAVDEIDPLLVGHADIRRNTPGSHDEALLHARV
jgi:hypothetical protein